MKPQDPRPAKRSGDPPFEQRFGVESRMVQRDGKRLIAGYGAKFNTLSEDLGGFRETIKPGAFKYSLDKGADVRALFNHDQNKVLGRVGAGTCRCREDDVGLCYEIDPPNNTVGNDAVESISRRDIDKSSFSFIVLPGGENWSMRDGQLVRELTQVHLFDVSPVTFPAYSDTSVAVRSMQQYLAMSGPSAIQIRHAHALRLLELI